MAATILAFPAKLFNASLRPSISAVEAAFSRPRVALNPAGRCADRPWQALSTPQPSAEQVSAEQLPPASSSVPLPEQVDLAVAHVDSEVAHYNARLRLLRLMTKKYGSAARAV